MNELLNLMQSYPDALKTHYHYAAFTSRLEKIYDTVKENLPNILTDQLTVLIFDLEVINGLALSDWEMIGKPDDWPEWSVEYKHEAKSLMDQLQNLLLGKQEIYQREI